MAAAPHLALATRVSKRALPSQLLRTSYMPEPEVAGIEKRASV